MNASAGEPHSEIVSIPFTDLRFGLKVDNQRVSHKILYQGRTRPLPSDNI